MTREEYYKIIEIGSVAECIIASGAYITLLEARIAKLATYAETLSKSLVESVDVIKTPKLCGNCIHMEKQGEDYYVCNDTEFQTCTTPDSKCFIGFKPKDSK